jgi:drug/metabolite transporter (DMT)-like permease
MKAGEKSALSAWVTVNGAGLLHLLVIYIVWGSTYLAIRVAVRPGAGFSPFILGTMRSLAAAVILLAWGAIAGQRLKLARRELLVLAGSGLLLWVTGNGLVLVSEQRVDSSLAALVLASTPLWSALIQAVIDRRLPSLQMFGALLIGIAGIAVLSMPVFLRGAQTDGHAVAGGIAVLLTVVGSISWAGGTVLMSRNRLALAAQVTSGYQLLFGGLGFLVMTLVLGEPLPQPVPAAWAAWGYLVLIGSVLAFTSYNKALRLLPTSVVMTYGYVNPVIAVFLGWVILSEPVTLWTVGGTALVLAGVAGVFRAYQREREGKKVDTKVGELGETE